MLMDTTKHTEQAKVIVVDESLNKYKSQPLPQHKTDMALRCMDSAKKVAKEIRERHKQQQKHGL